jgi:malonate-semialdehyde dehydrogenase (acetylating)/methylmalonate-semialdehyde dehydrogenase
MSVFAAKSYDATPFEPARCVIGGRAVETPDRPRIDVVNPRHGFIMSSVPMCGADEVAAAVAAAERAVGAWRDLPIRDRAQVMYRLRELMRANFDELSWLVSHENGKTYEEARAEVDKAIECVEFGCSLPNMAAGDLLDVSRGVSCQVVYEPIGVVAGITPFNFPMMVPLWMMPQALVGGNAFVLKPSENVPLSSMRLAELLAEAGLPAGIFSVVHGGREVVEALCDHPGIGAVGFVGSTRVAKMVYARGAAAGKRMLCLGGAKNHLFVVPDADPALTADNVVASFTGCAGQRCMAASVLLAIGDVDPILDAIVERARKIKLGADLGAITSPQALERIRGYVDRAEAAGVKVRLDGRNQGPSSGYWMGPTILDGVDPSMPAAREEIFGPVLSVVRVATVEEALRIENANPYGNAAAVYTQSGDVARKIMGRVSAGMCGVNVGVPVPREPFGFGGWNDSAFGAGNITGWDGYRFFTRQRKVTTKWALQTDQTWMS